MPERWRLGPFAITLESGKIIEVLGRRVGDVITTPVITAEPVTGELGRLVEYVSRSDILRAVVADPPLRLWR